MTEALPEVARRTLRGWYRKAGRHDLPWRLTRDPYAVLVSEVMLQQTQVERVIPYWQEWLARWPDATSMSRATPAEAIQAWSGLGYNRRALNLHRAAQSVVEMHDGTVPIDPAKLRELPGIGVYTANAVACFAKGRRVTVLDTNIARVFARAVLGVERTAAGEKATIASAEASLPAHDARGWNLALMDLGASVCTSREPNCQTCPLLSWCSWEQAGKPRGAVSAPRPATPFAETARFGRGRIIDALRLKPQTTTALLLVAGEAHSARIEEYLAALQREGLVEEGAGGGWRLRGDSRATGE